MDRADHAAEAPVEGDALVETERILRQSCGPRLRARFPLAPLTSFRIGGPAALYLEADAAGDLAAAGEAIARTGVPWTVIGKGSNVLVADGGFDGLVLRLGKGFRWAAREGDRLHAGGSMPLPALAGVALAHDLTGLEFGVAIPASLGGSVRMNAGAHGRSMHDVLETIDLYDLNERSKVSMPAQRAGFRYRRSTMPRGTLVVGAVVGLARGERGRIRELMDEARSWRRATQPLAEANCGSVFKNPPGDHAARLVDAAGLKGERVGGAEVSAKHANFIVAAPGATAADVRALIDRVRGRVRDRFGVELETEVEFVGGFGRDR